jgi:hypothetical protein
LARLTPAQRSELADVIASFSVPTSPGPRAALAAQTAFLDKLARERPELHAAFMPHRSTRRLPPIRAPGRFPLRRETGGAWALPTRRNPGTMGATAMPDEHRAVPESAMAPDAKRIA